MEPRNALVAAFFSAAVFSMTTFAPGLAQQTELVIVDIKAVAEDIARNVNVEASEIPLTVRAPLDVAAKVCGVAAELLRAQGARGGASCAATTTSPALERLVQTKSREQ